MKYIWKLNPPRDLKIYPDEKLFLCKRYLNILLKRPKIFFIYVNIVGYLCTCVPNNVNQVIKYIYFGVNVDLILIINTIL